MSEARSGEKPGRYGRSPVGQRSVCPLPQGHYQTTTLIAAVRLKGAQAPWLLDGAMGGQLFLAWVKQELVFCLQRNDVVVMENLATHKVAGAEGVEPTDQFSSADRLWLLARTRFAADLRAVCSTSVASAMVMPMM